jgi:hypothetical protein
MKEVILKVSEKKLDFFMELFERLGLEVSSAPDISEEQKTIIRERILKSAENPDRLLDWEEVQDSFQLD